MYHGHTGYVSWRSKLCEGEHFLYYLCFATESLSAHRLCSDAELLRNLWERYDAQDDGPKVVNSLITALKRLVTERPALLGQSSHMSGIGVQAELASGASSTAGAAAYGLDMAGRVASATVSGVAGIMGVAGSGLSVQGSSMKLQW